MTEWRPRSVNIELTLACNLRCKHCASSAGRPRANELSFAEWSRCFKELVALGAEELCLLGGEPLVRKDWEALAMRVGEVGAGLVLITNGLLVNPKTLSRIVALPHLLRVGVSLDAANPEVHDGIRCRPGAHEKALRALWSLRDAGVEVGAITTVGRENLGELTGLRDLLVGQNISWQLQVASPGGDRFDCTSILSQPDFYQVGEFIADCRRRFTPQELPVAGSHDLGYHSKLLGSVGELPVWTGCGAGVFTLGIMSDGRVKGCLSQHDDQIEASVRERSPADIWNDPNLFARNRRFTPDRLQGFCARCPHGATCRAGCATVAYTLTGRAFDNPLCFYRIERERQSRRRQRPRRRSSAGRRGPTASRRASR